MHRIHLITVGRVKTPWIREGIDLYAGRLNHSCDFQTTIIAAGEAKEEHKRLAAAIAKAQGDIILLDEKGKQMTSVEFSRWIGKKRDAGRTITFVIGGAYGFDDALRDQAHSLLSLSAMTLPHELAQLLFSEQLFRAHSILQGTGYHHGE